MVRPARIELAHLVPETSALSTELRAHASEIRYHKTAISLSS